jgi:cell division transport system permease protein
MKHWLRLHLQALIGTFRRMLASPFATVLNLLVIGVAVALPLSLHLVVANLQGLARQLPAEPQATVFLKTDASRADIDRVRRQLAATPGVAEVRYIDKQQALKELEAASGMQALIAGLGENPLPDAFAVRLSDPSPQAFNLLAQEAGRDPAIESVQLDAEWAQRLAAMIRLGRDVVLAVALLFGVGLVLVNANLIRMQILTRREEIEVSRLIGATDAFIRRPFLYFAAAQGLLGTLVGIGIVALMRHQLAPAVAELAKLYGSTVSLRGLDLTEAGLAAALVMLLSVLGALLSLFRHLRQIDH